MRNLAVVVVATLFASGLASAQMKAPGTSTAQSPVQIAPVPSPPEPAPESARRITREEAIKLVKEKKAVFVDVRAKEQYDTGHIPGALSIPLNELLLRLKEVPPNRMIITYCA